MKQFDLKHLHNSTTVVPKHNDSTPLTSSLSISTPRHSAAIDPYHFHVLTNNAAPQCAIDGFPDLAFIAHLPVNWRIPSPEKKTGMSQNPTARTSFHHSFLFHTRRCAMCLVLRKVLQKICSTVHVPHLRLIIVRCYTGSSRAGLSSPRSTMHDVLCFHSNRASFIRVRLVLQLNVAASHMTVIVQCCQQGRSVMLDSFGLTSGLNEVRSSDV